MREKIILCVILVGCAKDRFGETFDEALTEDTACSAATEGAIRCMDDEDSFERCRAGQWVVGVCEGGACVKNQCQSSACPDGQRARCVDASTVQVCSPEVGGWEPSPCPSGSACADGSCQPVVCQASGAFCDGNEARQCNDSGTASDIIETCGEIDLCVAGDCITACDLAEGGSSFVGCVYYALDTDNDSRNDVLQYDVVVGNPSSTSAMVTVSQKTADAWVPLTTVTVIPRGAAIIPTSCTGFTCADGNLGPDRHPEDTTIATSMAFRVESNVPVFAYQFNSDDRDGSASSSGATILLPKPALDKDYYALTLPHAGAERSWVSVVAMQDSTTVLMRVGQGSTVAGGGVAAADAGETIAPVSLDDGDVLQVSSASEGDDLTGTFISASEPVAVFAGHECAGFGGRDCGVESTGVDHIEEQMLPITAWGKEFVAARVRHPQQLSPDTVTWKIVAWKDDTTVEFESASSVNGLPDEPLTLDAGDVGEITTSGTPGHFLIHASQAVMVEQFTHAEPVGILVVPVEQYLADYVLFAPPFFTDTLTVVHPVGSTVELDGAALSIVWFDAGETYEVGWYDSLADGSHTINAVSSGKDSAPGIQLVGLDVNCSYGYLGGLNVQRINPID